MVKGNTFQRSKYVYSKCYLFGVYCTLSCFKFQNNGIAPLILLIFFQGLLLFLKLSAIYFSLTDFLSNSHICNYSKFSIEFIAFVKINIYAIIYIKRQDD